MLASIVMMLGSIGLGAVGVLMLLKPKEVAERLKRFYGSYPLVRYAGEQQLSTRSTFVSALGGILLLVATASLVYLLVTNQ
jgi:hypothetical protein